jgi:ACS family D-galactonate transporter-like MFS transporter
MPGIGPSISNARRWTIVGLLFASGFINYLDRAIVSVALPVIAIELHLGPAAKGVLLSAFFWSYALMQLPMGWYSDRYNLRWLYAGAFALWSLACGFTGLASTLGILIVLRVLMGVGESIYLPGGMKVVSLFFDAKDRGLASGLVNCGTRAGLALGAPLIAAIVVAVGWKNAFFILGFASLVWLIPWLKAYPVGTTVAATPAQRKRGQPRSWLDRNLLVMSVAHVSYGYYWYLLVTWLPDYLVVSRHLPLQKAGAFTAIPFLIYGTAEPVGGWMADQLIRHGWGEMLSRKVIITLAYSSSLLFLLVGHVANDAAAIMLIGGGALVGLSTGNILAMLQRLAPPDEVGLWTGFMNAAGNLSGIVAPIVTGLLIARTGSYYPAFVVSVFVLIVALPMYWWLLKDRKTPVLREAALAREDA